MPAKKPKPDYLVCRGCGLKFKPTHSQWKTFLCSGGKGIYHSRDCWLEHARKGRTKEECHQDLLARKRAYAAKIREQGAVCKPRGKPDTPHERHVELGPAQPLIPPTKCAGLPGKPCDTLTYNRRCDACKAEWDKMHDVIAGRYRGDEYGGFGMSAGGGVKV